MPPSDDFIFLHVTLPRLTGVTGAVIRGALGVADLSAMFDNARVPDADVADADRHHTTFLLQLEPDLEVGGHTRMGLVAVANDQGRIRLTVPWTWSPALRLAKFDPTRSVDEKGQATARVWADATPGESITVPLPIGKRQNLRIEVRVVPRPS